MARKGWVVVAESQRGLLTRRQARQEGLSPSAIKRRLGSGQWVRVLPGVYRIAGAPVDFVQTLRAAALYVGRSGAICGRAAALLHGFPRIGAERVELASHRNLRCAQGIDVHKTRLSRSDIVFLDGVPVTSELRTLVDLANSLDDDELKAVLEHLLRTRRFSAESLAKALARRRAPGIARLRRLVAQNQTEGPATESECEALVRDSLESWGLPKSTRQKPVRAGKRLRRLDFSWPAQRVALEVDGFFWHSDPAAFESDRIRRNALASEGWTLLHATWRSVLDDPETLFRQLSAALSPAQEVGTGKPFRARQSAGVRGFS